MFPKATTATESAPYLSLVIYMYHMYTYENLWNSTHKSIHLLTCYSLILKKNIQNSNNKCMVKKANINKNITCLILWAVVESQVTNDGALITTSLDPAVSQRTSNTSILQVLRHGETEPRHITTKGILCSWVIRTIEWCVITEDSYSVAGWWELILEGWQAQWIRCHSGIQVLGQMRKVTVSRTQLLCPTHWVHQQAPKRIGERQILFTSGQISQIWMLYLLPSLLWNWSHRQPVEAPFGCCSLWNRLPIELNSACFSRRQRKNTLVATPFLTSRHCRKSEDI